MADGGRKAGAAVVVVAAVSGGLHATGSMSRLAEIATGGETIASSAGALGAGLDTSQGFGKVVTGLDEAATFDRSASGTMAFPGHILSGGEDAARAQWRSLDQFPAMTNPIRLPLSPVLAMPPGSQGATVAAEVTGDAQARIVADLEPYRNTLNAADATDIIKGQLTKASEAIEKRDSAIKFVVLTGKLEIKPEFDLAGVNVSFGEVNVYKLAAIAGGTVMACKGLGALEFKACVAAALSAAGKAVLDAKAGEAEAKKE